MHLGSCYLFEMTERSELHLASWMEGYESELDRFRREAQAWGVLVAVAVGEEVPRACGAS